mmetsp:Transcript_15757/g.32284  ORF Transcript_15757/g.32284 Transcript_15757/m.32284 type:complete len:93 (+) Transcript_15757:173-451(+)|eukprot:CAMPEP_0183308178 /NCGR_PEP_ID=MMETSP0160_2-20130417/20300_1 /TAXON_ID=2839 ORGANISM="Odontella Sinensis, Strain Grunow 1884" /NCGR_SAMPLE_ID=MMETSP0160_2 /ASSEMBLY_ACC=CAM_ASM_000250 /LENGTH=92 /DNA_ID=CAMNT_0025471961 /DNA_START=166 /DNA_END=444 /DNA_ORIENTATION=+
MTSIVSQLLAPGGGILLIPFIKGVVFCLLIVTSACMVADVARIHMAVLSFLSAGLLVSLTMFQNAWDRMQKTRTSEGSDDAAAPMTSDKKTD